MTKIAKFESFAILVEIEGYGVSAFSCMYSSVR